MAKGKKTASKDYTKYEFDGKRYGKGQLVHAVVQKYSLDHPRATEAKLKAVFPRKEVHSTFEVVESVRKAAPGRFFLNPDYVIKAADKKIAVTNQWGKHNIEAFINYVTAKLMYPIRAVA